MLKVWVQPSEKEVTKRQVKTAMQEYKEWYGELNVPGINTQAARHHTNCRSCGSVVWIAVGDHQTDCDRCRKKVGF